MEKRHEWAKGWLTGPPGNPGTVEVRKIEKCVCEECGRVTQWMPLTDEVRVLILHHEGCPNIDGDNDVQG